MPSVHKQAGQNPARLCLNPFKDLYGPDYLFVDGMLLVEGGALVEGVVDPVSLLHPANTMPSRHAINTTIYDFLFIGIKLTREAGAARENFQ